MWHVAPSLLLVHHTRTRGMRYYLALKAKYVWCPSHTFINMCAMRHIMTLVVSFTYGTTIHMLHFNMRHLKFDLVHLMYML